MAKASGWAYGAVTDANIEQLFRNLALGWYLIGAIEALGAAAFIGSTGTPPSELIDAIGAFAAGYFLNTRRSRTLAIALVIYAVVTLVAAIARLFGLLSEGSHILLALAVLYLAWRSLAATRFYQHRRCANVRWAPTILISFAALLVAGAIFVWVGATELRYLNAGAITTMPLRYFFYTAALFIPPTLIVALTTMRWPFTEPDAACPWPPKKKP